MYPLRLGITNYMFRSHLHICVLKTARLHPQPPDSISNNHALERRKLGALAWLLWDQSTMVGAQTSRHHWQHVAGVTHAIACRLPAANTRNPLPLYKNTSIQHHKVEHSRLAGTWFPRSGR